GVSPCVDAGGLPGIQLQRAENGGAELHAQPGGCRYPDGRRVRELSRGGGRRTGDQNHDGGRPPARWHGSAGRRRCLQLAVARAPAGGVRTSRITAVLPTGRSMHRQRFDGGLRRTLPYCERIALVPGTRLLSRFAIRNYDFWRLIERLVLG